MTAGTPRIKLRVKKNDEVVVLSGRDKGKRGRILRVLVAERRVVVQGINLVKRHTKPRAGQPGGIVEKELPIHVAKVAFLDPKTQRATRVGYRTIEGGRKVRFAKRSGEVIDV